MSVDSEDRNRRFARELGLAYPVLSDSRKTVSSAYGVLYPLVRIARRVTFVIDKAGIIRGISTGGAAADPRQALSACKL